jgi:hypothetical protein
LSRVLVLPWKREVQHVLLIFDVIERSYRSRSSVQLQEIAALSLLVWVLLMIFATIKWPTQAKFAFTSLTLSSRPIFYINQIVYTADLSDKFSVSTGYLILKLRLEIVESAILILFVGGLAVYALISFNGVCGSSLTYERSWVRMADWSSSS